jgi:hypothetical protein
VEHVSGEENRRLWHIERLLEQEVILLKEILLRLPGPPHYRPTTAITVYPAKFD